MNKKIKSVASFGLLFSLTLASVNTITPKPANAVVGAIVGNLPTMIVGGALIGLGAATVALPSTSLNKYGDICRTFGCLLYWFAGIGGGAIGLIVLDDSGTASFGDLTAVQADRVGLTQGERIAYASELPEINAVFQSNQAERMAEFKATGKVSVENSKADWMSESSSLSPEAFSAIQKIAATAMSRNSG